LKLIYENVDITNDVEIINAAVSDNAGGVSDSLDIIFFDKEKLWRSWNPQKGDEIILEHEDFSSGIMYVDETGISKGLFSLRALSQPLKAKTPKTKVWENTKFISFATDMAESVGLKLETYGIIDWTYERVEQIEETSLAALNMRCKLEGYSLKISNGKAIIFDENTFEAVNPVTEITEEDFLGDYSFKRISSGLYSSCLINVRQSDGVTVFEYKPSISVIGPVLRPKVRATNIGEAERFAKNLLRNENKFEYIGSCGIKLNTTLAAGNTISAPDIQPYNGTYFLEKVIHNLTAEKTYLKMRKRVEGY
jgi:uncharacterized protein